MCGARHRSGRRVTWANLDGSNQPASPGDQPESNLEGANQPGSHAIVHLTIDQLDSSEFIWAESQHHRKVSWNLEDVEQEDQRFILRNRQTKKEDRGTAHQMAKKGKVGGVDDHLTPLTP